MNDVTDSSSVVIDVKSSAPNGVETRKVYIISENFQKMNLKDSVLRMNWIL